MEKGFIRITISGYSPLLWKSQGSKNPKQHVTSNSQSEAESSELIHVHQGSVTFLHSRSPEPLPRNGGTHREQIMEPGHLPQMCPHTILI